jgi:NTP pyrophosphatase (non-canonical NTP hydrolase)
MLLFGIWIGGTAMMTETEHLLSVLAEEAGEIVQACGKALRFGLDDGYPGTERTNAGDIATEIAHLKAVAGLLDLHAEKSEGALMDAKIAKVREFMEYARQRRTLMPNIRGESLQPQGEPK